MSPGASSSLELANCHPRHTKLVWSRTNMEVASKNRWCKQLLPLPRTDYCSDGSGTCSSVRWRCLITNPRLFVCNHCLTSPTSSYWVKAAAAAIPRRADAEKNLVARPTRSYITHAMQMWGYGYVILCVCQNVGVCIIVGPFTTELHLSQKRRERGRIKNDAVCQVMKTFCWWFFVTLKNFTTQ
jgi:hypothetical protein